MKAKTRFEIQFAQADGSYVRLTSRKELPPLTKAEAIREIEKFLALVQHEKSE